MKRKEAEGRQGAGERDYSLAISEGRKKLKKMETADICKRSGATYSPKGSFLLPYLDDTLQVQPPDFSVRWSDPTKPVHGAFEVLVLHYLRDARDMGLTGKWVSYRELPSGGFYYPVFRARAEGPLARRFGSDPDSFRKVAVALNGEPVQHGDAAFKMPTFPRLPLVFILWTRTEEFPARASVLFEASAEDHLNIEDLAYLGEAAVRNLIRSAERIHQSK